MPVLREGGRYLTAEPPFVASSALERLRETVVWRLAPFAARLRRQDRANEAFIRAALAYSGARVFVDGGKSPYRLRHLRRIDALDLRTVYLVRDLRGFALSNRVK